jgi:hypothetical protein
MAFLITIRPAFRNTPCEKLKEEEARGLFGFHNSYTCKNCKKKRQGWELHGENGHLQGNFPKKPTKKDLKVFASRFSTPTKFEFGFPVYYRSN